MASSSSCINNFKPLPPLPSHYPATCNQPLHCKLPLFRIIYSSRQLSQRLDISASVAFNPSGGYEMSLLDDEDGINLYGAATTTKINLYCFNKKKSSYCCSLSRKNNYYSVKISKQARQTNTRVLTLCYFFVMQDTPRVSPPEPPKAERYEVVIDNDIVKQLDISPFQKATGVKDLPSSAELKELLERTIGFTINFERENEYDSRELSEFPEIRLWFVRLDATYPWLPVMLDWRGGELARYAAMLVPHQMSVRMGVVFNPEALELFAMNKVFVVYSYLKKMKVPKPRLKTADMAKMLGFGIGEELFDLIDQQRYASVDD